jgi:hypothetical protein
MKTTRNALIAIFLTSLGALSIAQDTPCCRPRSTQDFTAVQSLSGRPTPDEPPTPPSLTGQIISHSAKRGGGYNEPLCPTGYTQTALLSTQDITAGQGGSYRYTLYTSLCVN